MKVFHKLDDFLDFAWVHISRGKADKKSPARHPTFITSSSEWFSKCSHFSNETM
jgi:hypothetical protein